MEGRCRSFLSVASLRIICRQQRDLFHFLELKTFPVLFVSGIFASPSLSLSLKIPLHLYFGVVARHPNTYLGANYTREDQSESWC